MNILTRYISASLPPMYQLRFEEDLAITKMFSGEGEDVPFCETLYPTGNVEDWLLEVERVMRASLKAIIEEALEDYTQVCDKLMIQQSFPKNTCVIYNTRLYARQRHNFPSCLDENLQYVNYVPAPLLRLVVWLHCKTSKYEKSFKLL